MSPTTTLTGQRALVTGAASGIGQACALALADAGAEVILADRADCSATRDRLGDARQIRVDVSDAGSVAAMFDIAGPLDIVVNSAGMLIESPILQMSVDDFDRQIAVNLRGSFLVAQGALRGMDAQGSGRLILIASELGVLGRADFSAYCASKAGVIALTRSLAREFAPRIHVNCVAPGPTDTPLLDITSMSPEWRAKEADNPLQRIGTPGEIASAVLWLASPGASFMTGQTICPSGGAVML
ncbi:MAG: short-chain dehydrogenase [Rhodobacteraceae bacterium]|nr:short-chain dehydrogenase [Paracoccaceae bacterium]MAY44309.1 short-chain dehydrogenase [Paracoccaceae bacterium]QEW19126.1 3-oxoacyl-[acyl-carrier-protein] reductase FabG [Marinibacterium anthonyi]